MSQKSKPKIHVQPGFSVESPSETEQSRHRVANTFVKATEARRQYRPCLTSALGGTEDGVKSGGLCMRARSIADRGRLFASASAFEIDLALCHRDRDRTDRTSQRLRSESGTPATATNLFCDQPAVDPIHRHSVRWTGQRASASD